MKFNLIVAACGKSLGIGLNGELPWRLKSEMKYFAETTSTTKDCDKMNAVIMGRKTWESIPLKFRPLKNRFNVILSRQADYSLNNEKDMARLCVSLDEGIDLVKTRTNIETCWIIGGSSIYQEAMNLSDCHRIYLTHIDQEFKCDVFFPSIDESYRELDENESGVTSKLHTENDVTYRYKVFEKNKV